MHVTCQLTEQSAVKQVYCGLPEWGNQVNIDSIMVCHKGQSWHLTFLIYMYVHLQPSSNDQSQENLFTQP